MIRIGFVVLLACALAAGRTQNINNYPYRPTFSDLDPYYYYTTPSPYQQQNVMRIWPYIIDQAVSPLYNWNWNTNGYGYGYNNNNNGYGGYYGNNNGYYNSIYGYTTSNPYWSVYNPYGTNVGKK